MGNGIKTCCFFGHRELEQSEAVLEKALFFRIECLIKSGFSRFLFGGYGKFDNLCFRIVKKLKEKYPHIKTVFVFAYYTVEGSTSKSLAKKYDQTVYPSLEDIPQKYAIVFRNRKMIDCSDFCVFYVEHNYGGANLALLYAKQKKKPYINIASELY